MKAAPLDELPEAANQKEIEKHLREMLGPPPQEATEVSDRIAKELSAEAPILVKPAGTTIEPTPEPITAPEIQGAEATIEKNEEPQTEDTGETDPEDDLPEDETTSEAVDSIVAEEGDVVLAADDAEVAKAFQPPKTGILARLKTFFRNWWQNKRARYVTLLGLVAIIFAAILLPASRYFLLNAASVRGSASLTVMDESSQQPLKNVKVTIGGQTALTGSDGKARLGHLRLGKSQLILQKRAYAGQNRPITIGWGSNPLQTESLKVVGSQYTINVKDLLSGKPVANAEALSGDANAAADDNGKILLAVEPGDDQNITVTISAKTYRDEKITFSLDTKAAQTVNMVSGRKEVFVSKRSGTYDVYKVDVDGKNQAVVLKGSGTEQDNMLLLTHPTDEVAAFVSTRDNVHNSDGFLLSTLTLIDIGNDSVKTIGQSERIRLVGWLDSRLVYVQIAAGASAANPKRYRLMSYDHKTGDKRELASGNYFNDVTVAGGSIYYALSSNSLGGASNLTRSNGDGTNKQVILGQEVWNIIRTSYENFYLSGQDWYSYKLGSLTATKLSAVPPVSKSRNYADSPDKIRSLWVDSRDGKGVLLAYDTNSKADKILKSQSGLNDAVLRWLSSSTLIYRVQTDQETADYVININGGDAKKIVDVTNTTGIEQGFFY